MRTFFYGIEELFVQVLFVPYDSLRFMESWWTANAVNWMFSIIGLVAVVYWMKQLKIFNDQDEEDKSISSHSYL